MKGLLHCEYVSPERPEPGSQQRFYQDMHAECKSLIVSDVADTLVLQECEGGYLFLIAALDQQKVFSMLQKAWIWAWHMLSEQVCSLHTQYVPHFLGLHA